MNRDRVRRSNIIEKSLLNAMSSIDDALSQMVALEDNANYTKTNQCKSKLREVLQRDYDLLAIKRKQRNEK